MVYDKNTIFFIKCTCLFYSRLIKRILLYTERDSKVGTLVYTDRHSKVGISSAPKPRGSKIVNEFILLILTHLRSLIRGDFRAAGNTKF